MRIAVLALALALAPAVARADVAYTGSGAIIHSTTGGLAQDLPATVLKPDGAGPFPAIVLLHDCSGLGPRSSYAPALANSLKTMDYSTFLGTVASGRVHDEAGTKFVMPSFGDNKNVMCFINDLYVYLKARASDDLPPGQLGGRNHVDKPEAAKADEKACLGE